MSGVVQALALRQLLRWSKGHPGFGTNPASGEMWLPLEIINASNTLINVYQQDKPTLNTWLKSLQEINPFYTRLNFWNLSRLQSVLHNHKPKEY